MKLWKIEKVSPKTVLRILENLMIKTIKDRDVSDVNVEYYIGLVSWISDCIVELKMKYDKEYADSVKNMRK